MAGASHSALLDGRWVLLTRAADESEGFIRILERAGARVRGLAFLRYVAPADPAPAERAARDLERYDWIAFTSARAVRSFLGFLGRDGSEARGGALPAGVRLACVGDATAVTLRERTGREPDLIPQRRDASGLADALLGRKPGRVLFPAAEDARPELPARLGDAGVEVTRVTVYRAVPIPARDLDWRPPGGRWDAIAFASGRPVRALLEALETEMPPEEARRWLSRSRPAVLGRSAEEALRDAGIEPAIRAARPSLEELAAGIVTGLSRQAMARGTD